ncbi:LacI family DNA-binding transcriptional regulator [Asticcacaulis solisilvae]|uniref:LacI family DNA-binding transcriptional regulator n=1 Tax=Asticcacaulis solisilvae TaxID=1217274 RepID=UPI003FD8A86B
MVTISDIAKATRHSTATVDRVLNNRPGVREDTRAVILKAAADLKYARAPAGGSLDFILPRAGGFMRVLAGHIEAMAAQGEPRRPVNVHFVDYDAPDRIAALLESLRDRSAGVGLVALDHVLIREALKGLIRRNLPVVTLLTDISSLPHQGYIGIDNRLAGRLAGHLTGRFLAVAPARVALFTGSRAYRGHEEREMGFRSIVREAFPHLQIPEALEISENEQAGFEAARALLAEAPDVAAIYNVGAGTAGIARALEAVPPARKPVFVAHDLSHDTRPHLLSGTLDVVIDQNAELTVERALARLRSAIGQQMLGVCPVMDARIIFRDNIPGS